MGLRMHQTLSIKRFTKGLSNFYLAFFMHLDILDKAAFNIIPVSGPRPAVNFCKFGPAEPG